MTDLDDTALLKLIAEQQDRAAFNELFLRYQQSAFSLACHILQNSALAEEAVQEAMMSIWVSPRTDLQGRTPREWILGTVAGKSLNVRRGQKKNSRREKAVVQERGAAEEKPAESETDELLLALRNQIEQLPELESQLLACSFGANLTHQKISEMLGLPKSTITLRIQQALQHLRLNLQKSGLTAVLPLAATAGVKSALTQGVACPAHLRTQVMQAIQRGTPAHNTSRRSRRSPKSSGQSAALQGAIAVAALAAVGLLAYAQLSAPAPQPAKTTPIPAPAPVAVVPEVPISKPLPAPAAQAAATVKPVREKIYKQWNFKPSAPADSDLLNVNKNTAWRMERNGTGELYSTDNSGILLIPKVTLDHQYMKITMSLHALGKHADVMATWVDRDAIASYDYHETSTTYTENDWRFESTFVFSSRECLQFFGDELKVVKTYEKDWPGDQLILQLQQLGIESITVESLTQEEMERVYKAARPAKAELLKAPVKRYEQQVIPANLLK